MHLSKSKYEASLEKNKESLERVKVMYKMTGSRTKSRQAIDLVKLFTATTEKLIVSFDMAIFFTFIGILMRILDATILTLTTYQRSTDFTIHPLFFLTEY